MIMKTILAAVLGAGVFALTPCASAAASQRQTMSDEFEVTIEIEPKRNLKAECSQLVVEQNDLDQALAVCNEAIEEAPDDGDRYYFRSYAHYYREEYEQADADATRHGRGNRPAGARSRRSP